MDMSTSFPQLVEDLLDLLLESDLPESRIARAQRAYLSVREVDYSGVGVFYYFHDLSMDGIQRWRNGSVLWDGVTITSPKVPIGAEAILHSRNGLIDYLEIWAHGGHYPQEVLTEYVLRQTWQGSPGRSIERG